MTEQMELYKSQLCEIGAAFDATRMNQGINCTSCQMSTHFNSTLIIHYTYIKLHSMQREREREREREIEREREREREKA